MKPLFSVVIATYNHFDSLYQTLEALARQLLPPSEFEVIVVDDGSRDGTADRLREQAPRWPFALSVLSQANRGPAAARNRGIARAAGSIVAMTDDDCLPQPGWLLALKEVFKLYPGLAGAEGRIECPDPHPLKHWVENRTGGLCWTANMAYARELLLQIGGFDETFPYPANEDIELRLRMLRRGRIQWTPEAVVLHPARSQSLLAAARKFRHLWSEYDLYRMHPGDYVKVKPLGHPTVTILFVFFLGPLTHLRDWWRFYLHHPDRIPAFLLLTVLERAQLILHAPFGRVHRRLNTVDDADSVFCG